MPNHPGPVSSALAVVSLVVAGGCAAPPALRDGNEAPLDGARQVTLRCNFEFEEGVDLGSGAVSRHDNGEVEPDVDLHCTMSRLIALRGAFAPTVADPDAEGFCAYDGIYDEPARFDALADVDVDCPLSSISCNYLSGGGYEPACVGIGAVVRDRFGERDYVLRVVSDGVEASIVGNVGVFVVEYAPLSSP